MSTDVIFSADGTLTSLDIEFEYMTSNLLRTASWLKLVEEILRFY